MVNYSDSWKLDSMIISDDKLAFVLRKMGMYLVLEKGKKGNVALGSA